MREREKDAYKAMLCPRAEWSQRRPGKGRGGACFVKWPPGMEVVLLSRLNRFACLARLPRGEEVRLHLPNSGRLKELLRPGSRGVALPAGKRGRRTWGYLLAVWTGKVWAVVDARLPPLLLLEAVKAGKVPEIAPSGSATAARREARLGRGRADLFFPQERLWVETKCVTLVQRGVALFPDAPTARGRRHLLELREVLASGCRAAAVFVVQRPDARLFAPHVGTDPRFARELSLFAQAGGEVYAYLCRTSHEGVSIERRIPVELPEAGDSFPGAAAGFAGISL